MKRYLERNGACDKFESFTFPTSVKIYAGTNLHLGDGMVLSDNCIIDANDCYGIYIGNNFQAEKDVYIRGAGRQYSLLEASYMQQGYFRQKFDYVNDKKINYNGRIYSIVIEDDVRIKRGGIILAGAYIKKGSVIEEGSIIEEKMEE